MEKRWWFANDDGQEVGSGEIVDVLLANRGIKDRELFFDPPEPARFLKQLGEYLPDLDLGSFRKACRRLEKAISSGEKIVIWGDFDVDGVSATAIFWQTLDRLGADVLPISLTDLRKGMVLILKGSKDWWRRGDSF